MNNDQLSITDESFVSPTPPLRERFVSSSPGNLFQTSVQFFLHLGVFFMKVKDTYQSIYQYENFETCSDCEKHPMLSPVVFAKF